MATFNGGIPVKKNLSRKSDSVKPPLNSTASQARISLQSHERLLGAAKVTGEDARSGMVGLHQ